MHDITYYITIITDMLELLSFLLEDNSISQPMQYISNALLAVFLGFLINYFRIISYRTRFKPSTKDIADNMECRVKFTDANYKLIDSKKYYHSS